MHGSHNCILDTHADKTRFQLHCQSIAHTSYFSSAPFLYFSSRIIVGVIRDLMRVRRLAHATEQVDLWGSRTSVINLQRKEEQHNKLGRPLITDQAIPPQQNIHVTFEGTDGQPAAT